MARCPPHHNIGHSSDNDGTDSSVSFRLDSDNAVGVDFPIDITDVTTPTYLYGEVTPAVPDTLSNGVPSRSPTALEGVAKQNDNSGTSSSDDDWSDSNSANDSDTDPDIGSSRKIDRLSNLKTQVTNTRNRPLHAPLQRVREGMGDKSKPQSTFHSKPTSSAK
ncbi:hypothetical protein AnigIFM60653_002373 [Aspergillus niger]|nr:hypothetical protein AnigIFM60653_002373 [Aspergillus niger]